MASDEKASKVGKIDLPELFEGAAQSLLLQVSKGKIIHHTKNIRDSGSGLETEFRTFIAEKLPSPFIVTTGYLFDPQSNCSPQIDVIVVDGQESHEMMRSEGAAYVPYPSAQIIVEVKNSSDGVAGHVSQIKAISGSIQEMTVRAVQSRAAHIPMMFQPLTVLVMGNTANATAKQFKPHYDNSSSSPDITLLLDRGIIIARVGVLDVLLNEDSPTLNMLPSRSSGQWAIWKPDGPGLFTGRALLWLYYAMVAHLNFATRGNTGTIHAFTSQIARDFPMVFVGGLQEADTWDGPSTV